MAMERILALTDLSGPSLAAVTAADALAARVGGRVDLGYVRPPLPVTIPEDKVALRRQIAEVAERHEGELLDAARLRIARERRGEVFVVAGECVRCGLRELAERGRPDVICLAARGGSTAPDLRVGGTALYAMRTTRVPGLLVHGPAAPPFAEPMRILLGVDLVESPDRSIGRVRWLLRPGDEVHLVHVVETQDFYPPALGVQPALSPAQVAELRRAASARLGDAGIEGARIHVEEGRPGDTLVSMARRLGPHLVVLRSHAARPYDPALLGPVSEHVLARCPAALLVLPKEEGAPVA